MDTNKDVKTCIVSYSYEAKDTNTIVYNIEVANKTGKSWLLIKRYSHFDELSKKLKLYFEQLPSLPQKSYLTFLVGKTSDDLEQRRIGLDTFLKQLVARTDVCNSAPLIEFLELDKHTSIQIVEKPKLVCEFKGFIHGVRDFALDVVNGLLFIVNSDMNVLTRVDAYMTNMKMPWESEKGEPAMIPVGCVECWIRNAEGEYVRAWTKGYNAQAICLYWDGNSNTLLVGLDSGSINLLTVSKKTSYKSFDESMEIEQHIERVMGLYYDDKRSLIHSVSKDHKYRVLNLDKQMLIADYEPGSFELTYLMVNTERQKAFVADRCGSIFVFDLSPTKPIAIVQLQTTLKFIRGLYLDPVKSYLFAVGYDEGDMMVFDIKQPGRESEAKEVAKLKNTPKSREICWSASRGEILVGNEDGTVTVFDAKKATPICKISVNQNLISYLGSSRGRSNKTDVVRQGSNTFNCWKRQVHKGIQAWKFPTSWFDKKLVEKEEQMAEQVLKQSLMNQKQQQQEVDDDDEDLESWHK